MTTTPVRPVSNARLPPPLGESTPRITAVEVLGGHSLSASGYTDAQSEVPQVSRPLPCAALLTSVVLVEDEDANTSATAARLLRSSSRVPRAPAAHCCCCRRAGGSTMSPRSWPHWLVPP